MNFLLFAYSALSVIYSVDYGSYTTKLGIALPGRIEVALNMQSKRYTPSYFAIYNLSNKAKTNFPEHWLENETRELNWVFAYDAQTQAKRFPRNAICGMPNLLENTKGLTGREIYAMYLKQIISTASDGKFSFENSKLMIAVDPWITRKERMAIQEAIEIGDSNVAGVIDSTTATATTYALERQSMYYNSSRTVAFLDIGHNHTWVSIYNFSSNGTELAAEQLSVASNETLGGRIIDETIANIFMEEFAKQYNMDLPFSDRVKARFVEEARRAKERLTVSEDTVVNIEDVIDEYCFNYKLTRNFFDTLFNSSSESLNRVLDSALNDANITKDQLDSIELLGGTSRIPFINESIRAWSGMEKLNRTMNSDEAIAVGSGYVGASKSSAFIIQKVDMKAFCGVNVSYIVEGKSYPLFNERTPLKEHKFVNYTAKDLPKNLTIHIDGEGDFFTYELQLPEGINETDNVTLEFVFNDMTIPELWNAEWNGTRLDCNVYRADWMITKEEKSESKSFLSTMNYVLWKRLDKLKLTNDHEALTYKLRDRLEMDEEFLSVISEEEKMNITRAIEEHQEWANNETARKTRSILREKLTQLENLTEKPDKRLSERKDRPVAFTRLNNTINETRNALNEIPNTKPWISEENITDLRNALNKTEVWFEDNYKLMLEENMTQDPVVFTYEINSERRRLKDKLDDINDIPKPKPVYNETNFTDDSLNGTYINASNFRRQPSTNTTDPLLNNTIPDVDANVTANVDTETNTTEANAETQPETNSTGGKEDVKVENEQQTSEL